MARDEEEVGDEVGYKKCFSKSGGIESWSG